MATAADVLQRAAREIGYTESPPNSNRNKFGAWYGINEVPWCAIFVSYCFYDAQLPLEISTPKGFSYCPAGLKWFKDQDQLFKTPQVGDLAFFDWDSDGISDHVGIVESVCDRSFHHKLMPQFPEQSNCISGSELAIAHSITSSCHTRC